jgi:hypothetical protein
MAATTVARGRIAAGDLAGGLSTMNLWLEMFVEGRV